MMPMWFDPTGTGKLKPSLRQGVAAVVAASIAMPATNLVALYSMIQQQGYAGPALTVRRASDSTTQDIGFVNGVVDKASADTFASGSALTVTKVYDQSGAGRHLVAPTTALEPPFLSDWEVNGIRPVSFCPVLPNGAYELRMSGGLPAGMNTQAVTVYSMLASRHSEANSTYWEMTDKADFAAGVATLLAPYQANNAHAVLSPNTLSANAFVPPRSHAGSITHVSSASGFLIQPDGVANTLFAAKTSATPLGFRVGQLTSQPTYAGNFDLFAMAIYSQADATATVAANENILQSSFNFERSGAGKNPWTKRVVYDGTSFQNGVYATKGKNLPKLIGLGRGAAFPDTQMFETISIPRSGKALGGAYTISFNHTKTLYDGTKSKNVYVLPDITNDLIAVTFQSQADAEAWATDFFGTTTGARTVAAQSAVFMPFVSAAKAVGFAVIARTTIPRGGSTTVGSSVNAPFDNGTGTNSPFNYREFARLKYNGLVLSQASALGYTVIDHASNANFADPNNTTYLGPDHVHPSDAGYASMAAAEKQAILAA